MSLKELQDRASRDGDSKRIYDEVTRLRWLEGCPTPETKAERQAERTVRVDTLGRLLLEVAAYANTHGIDLAGCLRYLQTPEEEEEDDGEPADE